MTALSKGPNLFTSVGIEIVSLEGIFVADVKTPTRRQTPLARRSVRCQERRRRASTLLRRRIGRRGDDSLWLEFLQRAGESLEIGERLLDVYPEPHSGPLLRALCDAHDPA
jgi:hypothetical protein